MKKLILVLLLLNSAAYAQKSTIIGVGAVPCSEWSEARKAAGPKSLQLRAWLFGFISGINAGLQPHGDMLAGEGSEAFAGWVDRYCQDNPTQSLGDAANEMATDFVRNAIGTEMLKR